MADDTVRGLLGDLVFASGRLTRVAAQLTGNTESPATWRTINSLRLHGSLRLGELAALSRVSQPTMTKLVAGLEERGFVTRVPDADDARASRIAATDAGLAAMDAWRDELAAALHPYFSDLGDEDVAALHRTVRLLEDRVDARSVPLSRTRKQEVAG